MKPVPRWMIIHREGDQVRYVAVAEPPWVIEVYLAAYDQCLREGRFTHYGISYPLYESRKAALDALIERLDKRVASARVHLDRAEKAYRMAQTLVSHATACRLGVESAKEGDCE